MAPRVHRMRWEMVEPLLAPNADDARVYVEGERGALLDLLVARATWLERLGVALVSFPPEVYVVATRLAAENGNADELLLAIQAIRDLHEATQAYAPKTKRNRFGAAYAIGHLLGMDPNDANMRLWSGKPTWDDIPGS